MLCRVMQKLKSNEAPIFNCIKWGTSQYQHTVVLDVSAMRFSVEPRVNVHLVFGDLCTSAKASRLSAVMEGFMCLEKSHFIDVLDYSSSVVECYKAKGVFGNANSCSGTLENVLRQWDAVLEGFKTVQSQLASHEMSHTVDGVITPTGEIYSETKVFFDELICRFSEKHSILYAEYSEYEAQRALYVDVSCKKTNAYIRKVDFFTCSILIVVHLYFCTSFCSDFFTFQNFFTPSNRFLNYCCRA